MNLRRISESPLGCKHVEVTIDPRTIVVNVHLLADGNGLIVNEEYPSGEQQGEYIPPIDFAVAIDLPFGTWDEEEMIKETNGQKYKPTTRVFIADSDNAAMINFLLKGEPQQKRFVLRKFLA